MAQMIISLRCDPVTGKKDIVIKLHSDPDALPIEHEQQHRALVDKLIEGGIVRASEVGKVVVEREQEENAPLAPVADAPRSEGQARGQKG
jgi:hypothetical protein